jgi:ketosteroid isomerase-like protein
VAKSGDLAWTWGKFILHTQNGDRTGKYVTIWRRQPGGQWVIDADIGSADPLPKSDK